MKLTKEIQVTGSMVLSSLPFGEMGVLGSSNCVLWRSIAEVGRRVRANDRLVQRSIEGRLGLVDFDVNIVDTVLDKDSTVPDDHPAWRTKPG